MKIQASMITKLSITDVPNLDPIDVMLEDIRPGAGRITIKCYTKAWTAYWGAMGDRTIGQFFCDCDEHYLAGNLNTSLRADISDDEAIADGIRKAVVELRRDLELSADRARELFDSADEIGESPWHNDKDMVAVFGDDWYVCLPTRPNPKYQYLYRIIKAVQDGLRMMIGVEVAA